MAKSSFKQIAEDEQKIIQQLIEDARQNPAEIAEHCGFSRQKVWRIINKLEENKKIWGYTTVVDDETAGGKTYFVLVKAKAPLLEIIEKLITRTKNGDIEAESKIKLLCIHYVHGIYDGIVVFSAKDIWHAKRFCGNIQKQYKTHIERVDLLEDVFPLINFGKINPNIDQLKEFAIV